MTLKINLNLISKRLIQTMSAWQINSPSKEIRKALNLNQSLQVPIIRSPNEVLIKMKASSVNLLDVDMCTGYGDNLIGKLSLIDEMTRAQKASYHRYPLTLGRDISGVIVNKGANVKFKIGDEVWGTSPPYKQGSHSEYVIVDQCDIYLKPRNLSNEKAASLPFVFLTAWSALSTFGGLNEKNCFGKRILVLGGSGGVGTLAIQLLKAWGAYVTTTCSSQATSWLNEKTEVDDCIDYKTNQLDSLYESFDFVLDAAKRESKFKIDSNALKCLKPANQSKYVSINSPLLNLIDNKGICLGLLESSFFTSKENLKVFKKGIKIIWAFYFSSQAALKYLTQLVQEGKIRSIIDQEYQFNSLPEAYIKVQEGHLRGKIVIQIQ